MGKIILRGREKGEIGFDEVVSTGLSVKYLKSSDSFEFKGLRITKADEERELRDSGLSLYDLGESFSINRVVVKGSVLSAMIMADKMDLVYHWSVGYESREKLGRRPGDFGLLRDKEYAFLRESVGMEAPIDYDDYLDLCVWQYCFNISETILRFVKVLWKKKRWGRSSSEWLQLKKRENFGGREWGSKNLSENRNLVLESDADFDERISHNKKVAITRGIFAWYLEACREECKRKKVPFNRDECASAWNKARNNI